MRKYAEFLGEHCPDILSHSTKSICSELFLKLNQIRIIPSSQYPQFHSLLRKCILTKFHNGDGKLFLQQLVMNFAVINSEKLFTQVFIQVNSEYHFKFILSKEENDIINFVADQMRNSSSSSSSCSESNTINRRYYGTKNLRYADAVVFLSEGNQEEENGESETESEPKIVEPRIVVEVESHGSKLHDSMAQAVSYALAIRIQKMASYPIGVCVITSSDWYIAALPKIKEDKKTIIFQRFRVIESRSVRVSNYLAFLNRFTDFLL